MSRGWGAGLLVATTMLLFAACSGNTPSKDNHATATIVVAATNTVSLLPTAGPSATPLIAGPDVRLCHGEDIDTSVSPNGAGGMLFAFITLANRSNGPCQIAHIPNIQLFNAQGNVLPVAVTPGRSCPAGSCVFQQPLLLLPGLPFAGDGDPSQPGQALLVLAWPYTDSSGAVCSPQTPKATQVRLLLGSDESTAFVDVTKLPPHGGIVQCRGIEVVRYGPP